MDGENPVYVTVPLLSSVKNASTVVSILKCDNCAICASYTRMQPRLEPFSIDLMLNSDCAAIAGITQTIIDNVTYLNVT